MQNSGGEMAGEDELIRVVRNKKKKKNATLKFLSQNIVPGLYYLYLHLGKKQKTNKYTVTFFPEKKFL